MENVEHYRVTEDVHGSHCYVTVEHVPTNIKYRKETNPGEQQEHVVVYLKQRIEIDIKFNKLVERIHDCCRSMMRKECRKATYVILSRNMFSLLQINVDKYFRFRGQATCTMYYDMKVAVLDSEDEDFVDVA